MARFPVRSWWVGGGALAALAALAAPLLADRIVTEDGRVITVKKAREKGDGYVLEFEHGVIELSSAAGLKAVEIEGDMSDYEPKNDDEREKLERGYVRYRGKWMSKSAYRNLLRKEHEASRERADAMAAYAKWYSAPEIETKHFIIKTNTSPELAEYYEKLLEGYYKLMDKRVGIKPTPTMRRTKMKVNIYKSRGEFQEKTNVAPGVAGFFTPTGQSLNFFHNYADPTISNWVGLHECTHLLTYLIDQQFRPQIWINEAVADYFGSATITEKKGKLTIEPGRLQTDRVLTVQQALRDGEALGLERLFQLTKPEFHAFEYAHAWSFVYFLNEYDDGRYRKGFNRFFRDLYTLKGVEYESVPSYGQEGTGFRVAPDDIRDLLLKKIGVKDVTALEGQWHGFIEDILLDAPDALFKRGLRYVATSDFDLALLDFDQAIDGGLEDARAYANRAVALSMLGRVSKPDRPQTGDGVKMSRRERMEKARADMLRAIGLDPLNALYRHQLSFLLLDRPPFQRSEPGQHAEAKAAAGLALELDPENEGYADWYEAFE